jgi:protein gp37
MATRTKIEWTEMSWNPVTGCSKISPGCANCYAERMALRLRAMGQRRYKNGFSVTLHPDLIDQPDKWSTARTIFVNSMSDLFHDDVPLSFIKRVFNTICRNPHHTFQVLTKRSERLSSLAEDLPWPHNLWMGVSIEDSECLYRVKHLIKVPAAVRFLSCEPLIGSIESIPLSGIHWVIVGGESGPHARIMRKSWVDAIRKQCTSGGIPFFFKQWGGVRKNKTGRTLNGRTYDEMPKQTL